MLPINLMSDNKVKKVICHISNRETDPSESHKGDEIKKTLFDLIVKDYPGFSKNSYISTEALNKYRKKYLSQLIASETGEMGQVHHDVVEAITENKILSENIEPDMDGTLTLGQKVADKIADFGGSWSFIIAFFSFIVLWMLVNIVQLLANPFDPFPFILLNLILSCLAAIQAPIIMMSQNRQEQKDRLRSEHDYKINLKAELEIKLLHDKIDHLMMSQNKRLLEIQELQTDYLEDILKKLKAMGKA